MNSIANFVSIVYLFRPAWQKTMFENTYLLYTRADEFRVYACRDRFDGLLGDQIQEAL